MTPGARLAAAIEVITDLESRHRPAGEALRDWGRAHRFAGSRDRAAIGNLVFDALRRRQSLAWKMGDDAPMAVLLGVLRDSWGLGVEQVVALAGDGPHAAGTIPPALLAALEHGTSEGAPDWVRGDIPEWLAAAFATAFGERMAQEGAGLSARAPVDLRVNTLRSDRDKVLRSLVRLGAVACPMSPTGVRIPASEGVARQPHVEAEPGHGKGWFEIQDEASQLAILLAGAKSGQQVAYICAGAGGKTLGLAAAMGNTGQIHAWDADKHRLRPIFERLKRAGVRNTQVLAADDATALSDLAGRMDVVLVDAPCTGTGVWRRRPDAKWRLTPAALERRLAEQRTVLDTAAPLAKPGGRLVYATCSVLVQENNDQVAGFLDRYPEFSPVPYARIWTETIATEPPHSADDHDDALLLTPARHGCDGFFVAALHREA